VAGPGARRAAANSPSAHWSLKDRCGVASRAGRQCRIQASPSRPEIVAFAPESGGFAVEMRVFAIPDPVVAKSGVGSMAYGDHPLTHDVPEVAHRDPEVSSRRRPEIRKFREFRVASRGRAGSGHFMAAEFPPETADELRGHREPRPTGLQNSEKNETRLREGAGHSLAVTPPFFSCRPSGASPRHPPLPLAAADSRAQIPKVAWTVLKHR
jgi:hypothetical protein